MKGLTLILPPEDIEALDYAMGSFADNEREKGHEGLGEDAIAQIYEILDRIKNDGPACLNPWEIGLVWRACLGFFEGADEITERPGTEARLRAIGMLLGSPLE